MRGILVVVHWRKRMREDGVPDYGAGGRRGFGCCRGVRGGYVEEDLLGVPGEEGGEVCVLCVRWMVVVCVKWV